MLAASPHCAPPGVSGFALPQLKRKRSDSSESATTRDAPVATKLRTDDACTKHISQQRSSAPSTAKVDAGDIPTEPLADQTSRRAPDAPPSMSTGGSFGPSAPSRDDQKAPRRKVNVDRLRETLEAQLSLEVLLKHNELRFIDQEIAKCQVALEQLRRCAEIPYPGSHTTGPSLSVSNGTGMSVWAPGNGPAPRSPAPWGVTNGPYTRHYARWLLPDPRFDGGEVEQITPIGMGATTPLEGRSTRGNPIDTGYLAGKSTRPQRGSTGTKLQSLPSGYPAPKERAGPMIIRRKSDGVLVKLVCLDCRRDNFSSTQGFINHCRIAHNRNFASHDAAAVASGEPVEVDDTGTVIGGKNEPSTGSTSGFVHPLIRSAHIIESTSRTLPASGPSETEARKRSSTVRTPLTLPHTPVGPKDPVAKATNDTFNASKDTPHLSSLMKMRGIGLDLGHLVGEAKTAVDLDGYSSDEGDSEPEPEPLTPSVKAKPSNSLATRAGRQPMRTTASQTASERPDGHKGVERPGHQPLALETLTPTQPSVPYQSPYAPAGPQLNDLREVDLSPNTESNQAPSLVSDDDDYEAVSDSDSPGPCSSDAEHGDDFGLIDVEDDDTNGSATASDSNPKADVGLRSAAKPLKHGSIRKKGQYPISSSVVPLSQSNKEEKRTSTMNLDLNPSTTTLATFNTLLGAYETTVRQITRTKALTKSKSRLKAKSKAMANQIQHHKRAAPSEKEEGEDLDSVAEHVREFLELDVWRYDVLPALVEERRLGKGRRGGHLSKEDLVRLMEWKLKHGVYRPALLGMIRQNKEKTISDATASAFSSLPASDEENESFEAIERALSTLVTPLRGVGPATASLILSVACPEMIPFYSDDVYLWVCVGIYPSSSSPASFSKGSKEVKPNGELNVKYNVAEYRRLWEGVQGLTARLNGEVEEGKRISCKDVEKVALVVRHFGLSGLGGCEEGEEEQEDGEEGTGKSGEGGRKRRRI
ncbi:hypothetical protein BDW68DRAFT_187929 [Aspergillus falconensis]